MKLQVSVTRRPRVLLVPLFSYVLACGSDESRLHLLPRQLIRNRFTLRADASHVNALL